MGQNNFGLPDIPATVVELIGETDQRDATIDDKFGRTYRRTFLVKAAPEPKGSILNAGAVAIACQGVPAIFDAYRDVGPNETDPPALLARISARPRGDTPDVWEVPCEYTTKPAHPDYQAADPRLRKRRRRTRTEREKEAVEFDFDGNKVANSAGDPFEAIEEDTTYKVIEIEKNLASDPEPLDVYLNCVNNDPAFGKEAGQLKVFDISCPDEDFDNGVRFWPTKLVLHSRNITLARPQPWRRKVLDRGFRSWNPDADAWFDILDGNGRPVSQPALLDGNGVELAHGAAAVYRTFQTLPELTFATLVNLFS